MNCQELHAVLDTDPREKLTAAQRQDVDTHFGSCRACREAWAAYRELVAEQIPHTPPDLQRRVAEAIDAKAPEKVRGLRRSIVLGGVLVVGAAVAKTLSLSLERSEQMCTRL
jgi:predicted anti-sigma-YlaC factor YlaD